MTLLKFARWVLWAAAGLAVIAGLYLSVFFVPYPLFRHHAEYEGLSFYSDREIGPEFADVAKDARWRLDRMGAEPGKHELRIFICNSQRLSRWLFRLAGKRSVGQALVISAAGNAFFSVDGITAIGRRNGGRPIHSRLEGSWSAAIAHEVAHLVIDSRLGDHAPPVLPPWKSEGSADFLANRAPAESDPDYDFRARVELLLDDRAWRPPVTSFDRRHFRWHVLVEFLRVEKGLSFDEVVDSGLDEATAWSDLMSWYSSAADRGGIQNKSETG